MADDHAADAAETFHRWVAAEHTKSERFGQMRARAEQVTVTETSPDGGVTVTVNAGGVLTDLTITDEATARPGARVAAEVLATMRRAQARLADRVGEVMRDTIGDDRDTMDRVLDVYHDRFPEPAPPATPTPSGAPDTGEEDGAGPILRRR